MALRLPRPLGGPMCKGGCREKGLVLEGWPDQGDMALRLPRPLRGQCAKAAVKKKGGVGRGAQIRGIWP